MNAVRGIDAVSNDTVTNPAPKGVGHEALS